MSLKQLELNERRVVVLGANGSNKTSVISTLFGQTEYTFVKGTRNCVKTDGLIDGRKFIFVDTPGWWRNYRLVDTAEFIKRKLLLSMSECVPGPHTFMLVVNTAMPFSEKDMTATKEHLGLFGEKVWEHTIVVFTRREALGDLSIEQFIESGGEALKALIEKCDNRYQYCYRKDGLLHKVKKILEMIDDMIGKNGGHYFEFDERMLKVVEQKRMEDHERGTSRQLIVKSQREIMTKQGVVHFLPEIRLVLLGWVFSGKTFARNIILGLTDKERRRTKLTESMSGKVAERQISVVDTPGWYKHFPVQYIPKWVKTEIQRGLTLDSKNAHVILLAVPVDTTFNEEQRKITEDNMEMFGEQIWRHTIVLFTCGDLLGDTSIEEHIESEGEPLRWLVEKCGNRYHVLSWSDEEDQVLELLRKTEEMVTGNSFFCPESRAEIPDTAETIHKQSAQYLDLEWEKMDKALKEMTESIWNETTHNRRSINAYINFNDSTSSSEKSHDNSMKSTGPLSTQESGITNATSAMGFTCDQSGQEDKDQTSENDPDQMKGILEMTEREKARLETYVIDQFQPML